MFSPVPLFNVDDKNQSLLESDNFKGRYGTSKREKIKKHPVYTIMLNNKVIKSKME